MSFVSLIDRLYPVVLLPRWLVHAYSAGNRFFRKYALNPYKGWKAGHRKKRLCFDKKCPGAVREGFAKYSVITPVRNMSRYLDEYFQSLSGQTLDFTGNMQLILVDAGSTDDSAAIIKAWQKRYPDNITYIFQENPNTNNARNAGLSLAAHPWVAWIDAVDFVHPDYFLEMDQALRRHGNNAPVMLACQQIAYHEALNEFRDDLPFSVFFKQGEALKPAKDLGDFLHVSVNNALFSHAELARQEIRFSRESDRSASGDACFVLRYFAEAEEGASVLFCDKPLYYCRRRGDAEGETGVPFTRKEYFLDPQQTDFLELAGLYRQTCGYVPNFVQRSILYDISLKIREIFFFSNRIEALRTAEKEQFLSLCDTLFSCIDTETVEAFPQQFSNFTDTLKLGALHCFKNIPAQCRELVLDDYDYRENQVRCRFAGVPEDGGECAITLDGVAVQPAYTKVVRRTLWGRTFFYEFFAWIPLAGQGELRFSANGEPLPVTIGNKTVPSIRVQAVTRYFFSLLGSQKLPDTRAAWIFIDREAQADDNAEHLYRYVAGQHPEREIYFALRKSSSDWKRLEAEGFRLVDYGSGRYFRLLYNCAKVISSQADRGIVAPRKGILRGKDFVFLQHGITTEDLSTWLNTKKITLMVTGTQAEYHSLVADGTPYYMGSKEVALTGFPRHDALLDLAEQYRERQRDGRKMLFVMPTWRKYLDDITKGLSDREAAEVFEASDYARHWLGLLRSPKLCELCSDFALEVVFFSHFRAQHLFDQAALPSYVVPHTHCGASIQQLFARASVLVTDFSSVSFEVAYLHKPVVYYQFDADVYYDGAHSCQRGYYDYLRDGFGPVAGNREDTLAALRAILARGGAPEDVYLERIRQVFPIRDGKCCARVYEAIDR